MTPDKQRYFAHDTNGVYFHASPSRRVDARTSGKPDYWGWLATGNDRYMFVRPSKIQLDMCFAGGMKYEEDRGRGRGVSLIVEKVAK